MKEDAIVISRNGRYPWSYVTRWMHYFSNFRNI